MISAPLYHCFTCLSCQTYLWQYFLWFSWFDFLQKYVILHRSLWWERRVVRLPGMVARSYFDYFFWSPLLWWDSNYYFCDIVLLQTLLFYHVSFLHMDYNPIDFVISIHLRQYLYWSLIRFRAFCPRRFYTMAASSLGVSEDIIGIANRKCLGEPMATAVEGTILDCRHWDYYFAFLDFVGVTETLWGPKNLFLIWKICLKKFCVETWTEVSGRGRCA